MVTATLAFAGMSACIQFASRTLPSAEVVFVRNVLGLVFLLPWLLYRGTFTALRTRHPIEHLIRGIAGLASMYCYFFAIAHLRLADAVVLNYTVPLFFPLIESFWLREPMPAKLWWPLVLGFVGIAFVLRPGTELFRPVALIAVAAGLLSAVAQTGIRRLTLTEPPERIVFIFALVSSVISAVPMPVVWVAPTAALSGLFVLLGVCATVGQLSMTRAYAHAPASQVGAFVYATVIFAAVFDWIRTRESPRLSFVVGAVLICGAGALMLKLVKSTPPRRAEASDPA